MLRTTVTGVYDGGTFGALERVAEHLPARGEAPLHCFWRIAARRAMLCAGAIERPLAFANNDRPGVMLAGAVRAYLNRWAVAPRRAAVFTACDDGWRTAADLAAAGVEVVALVDARARRAGPARAVAQPPRRRGRRTRTAGASSRRSACGGRAASSGSRSTAWPWPAAGTPPLHLTSHLGARPVWDAALAAFLPADGAVPGLAAAGAAAGDFSTRAALAGGAAAAAAALADLGFAAPRPEVPEAEDAPAAQAAYWQAKGGRGRAWLDFQNDVTVKDVALAARENFRSAEHMKRYTTLGMATDQGKVGGVAGLAVLAELTGRSIAETGTTTFRPPYVPVPIAALGAGGARRGPRPPALPPGARRHNGDGCPLRRGGPLVPPELVPAAGGDLLGGRLRPRGGDGARRRRRLRRHHPRQDRRPGARRRAPPRPRLRQHRLDPAGRAGAATASCCARTASSWTTAPSARLGDSHFLLTTTTAAAGEVMAHLEFCLQCLWPDLDAQAISVTDQWAQVAVAGPRSRELVNGILAGPSTTRPSPSWPAARWWRPGCAARLFRISFSGEHGLRARGARPLRRRPLAPPRRAGNARSAAAPTASRR